MENCQLMTPPKFAESIGLPYKLVNLMLKQGKLPFIQPEKRVYILTDAAIAAIRNDATNQAELVTLRQPKSIIISNKNKRVKKNIGRLPDKVKARLNQGK